MRTSNRPTAVAASSVLALATALIGCGAAPAQKPKIKTTVRAGVAPVPPTREGAYFGAWVDPAADQGKNSSLGDFEKSLGRRLDIVQVYRTLDQPFPRQGDSDILASGSYLMLTLTAGDTNEIAHGRQDKTIRERARAIKATGKPIFLRWQPDMDGTAARRTVHSAAAYVAAWSHLRLLFRAEGADNAAWVWCPTARGFDAGAARYYPGDAAVDWICADAYPRVTDPYRDLSDLLKSFTDWAANEPKPIMIGEFGVPRSYGTRRAEWLRKAVQTLQNPQIKAVLYFDGDAPGKATDNRLQYSLGGDDAALSAIRELATTPYFNPRNLPVQSG